MISAKKPTTALGCSSSPIRYSPWPGGSIGWSFSYVTNLSSWLGCRTIVVPMGANITIRLPLSPRSVETSWKDLFRRRRMGAAGL